MSSGAIELRNEGQEIALRNEEINRRRLQRGNPGGPLRVTDPAAFARLMAEMSRKAEEQREAEAQREAERARREGANYKTKEEREREAKAAKAQAQPGEDEARQLERRFDPSKNYYEALGVDRAASTAEIKRAYKKFALAYHPDKHKAEDAEQQAAVADRFKAVVEAYDVLSDEAQRAVYDKVRDYQEANPGRGLPVLSPEEAAMMRSGAAELRRLRRMGTKLTKHKALEKEVWVSLEKLNGGGMKRVVVERQRMNADGSLVQHTRTFHLVIRKGMQENDRLTFEGEGEEAVDTQPGDLVFILRQKPHPVFKRSGRCNLEVFARALAPGETLIALDLTTLQGKRRLLRGSAWAAAAAGGCVGGMWREVVAGQGLYDPQDPWDNPPGDLIVQVRYPGFQLGRANVRSCLRPRPVHLLGSPTDVVAGALVGGCLSVALAHRLLAEELLEEEHQGKEAEEGEGVVGERSERNYSDSSSGGGGQEAAPACQAARTPTALCLSFVAAPAGQGSSAGTSPAAHAALRVLARRVPGLALHCVTLSMASAGSVSLPAAGSIGAGAGAGAVPDDPPHAPAPSAMLGLLDDEWCAVHGEPDIIILDTGCGGEEAAAAAAEEPLLRWAEESCEGAALLQALWAGFWRGASLVAVGGACALLGARFAPHGTAAAGAGAALLAPPVLPWYILRAGGGEAGWAALHAGVLQAAGAAGAGAVGPPRLGVGVMAGSACTVDPFTGQAELLVAPSRDTLVATARWAAGQDSESQGLQEAWEDHGFFYAVQAARL